MAYTTINKSTSYFNTKLYTGNNSSTAQTGIGFQPDFSWFKRRDSAAQHSLFDSVRGVTKALQSNSSDAEATISDALTSFDSDGFTLGADSGNYINYNSATYASWNWKAGTTSGITQGGASITPTAYSFNATSGFSIIKYTGTGSNATVPHGLGVAPKHIMFRRLDSSENWINYHEPNGNTGGLYLSLQNAFQDNDSWFNDTSPTSDVFTIGTNGKCNASGGSYIAYCFAEKTGFSKIGAYEGNNSAANGPFIYCGFKPTWILIKNNEQSNKNWLIYDSTRDVDNPVYDKLNPNQNDAESDDVALDIVSNGFRMRQNGSNFNDSYKYSYMAFGQTLVTSTNVPATAR